MTEIDYKKMLVFLERREVLKAFKENEKKQSNYNPLVFKDINESFIWSGTPQGHDYWCELEREYFKCKRKGTLALTLPNIEDVLKSINYI